MRRLAVCLAAVLMIGLVPNGLPIAFAEGDPPAAWEVSYDFDEEETGALPEGWIFIQGGFASASIEEVPSAADKSLGLHTTRGSDAIEANVTIAGLSGRVAIEANMMTTGRQFSVAPYIYNNNNKSVMKFGFRDGYFLAIGNTERIETVPFVPYEWYHVKIVIHTEANTYDLWINRELQTVNRHDLIQPFDEFNHSITRVMFKADNTSGVTTSYVDDVKVYVLPPAELERIEIALASDELYEGDEVSFSVRAVDAEGGSADVTGVSLVRTSDPSVVAVNEAGMLRATGAGTARISAVYAAEDEKFYAETEVTVHALPELAAPQDVWVSHVRASAVELSWSAVEHATKYTVYRADASGGSFEYAGQSQQGLSAYIDNQVSPSSEYVYKVSAVLETPGRQVQESAQSGEVPVRTLDAPVDFPRNVPPLTVEDDFNQEMTGSVPSGWMVIDGEAAVQEIPFAENKSMVLNGASVERRFRPLAGIVTAEAKVKAHASGGEQIVYDGQGNVLASFQVNSEEWTIIRFVIDTDADMYDLYVDGVKRSSSVPIPNGAEAAEKLAFRGHLIVDDVNVYSHADVVEAPNAPVFDVKDFGAAGDGVTMDTEAIQAAVDAAEGTGGTVVLRGGVFLSGTIRLKSDMNFYIAPDAVLKGSPHADDYPDTQPLTHNTQLGPDSNVNKALLLIDNAERVRIDGGGTIDGSGEAFRAEAENVRPSTIYSVLSEEVTIQNLYITQSAMWTVVVAETDYTTIRNIHLDVNLSRNRDGIDIVDSKHVLIERVTVHSGDDAIVIKSGKRRGASDILVRHSNVTYSGTNGLKFGTASFGAFQDIAFEDIMIKNVKYCAMCVESVDGADVSNIRFQRIDVTDAGNPFFVLLGKRSDRVTKDDGPKQGTMNHILFRDIIGKNMKNSWGSPISGAYMSDGSVYRIKNVMFDNVHITYSGGVTSVPPAPPEYALHQYPESNLWSNLPAYGYYVRHVDGFEHVNSTAAVDGADAREAIVLDDVNASLGIVPEPAELHLLEGEIVSLQIIQSYENGETLDVTAWSRFASSDPDVVIIDAAGKVKAVGPGTAKISVSSGVYETELEAEVRRLIGVELTMDAVRVKAGETLQTSVTGWFESDGRVSVDLSGARITYYSSRPKTAVADEEGVIHALHPGRTEITAVVTLGHVTVSSEPVPLIVTGPANP